MTDFKKGDLVRRKERYRNDWWELDIETYHGYLWLVHDIYEQDGCVVFKSLATGAEIWASAHRMEKADVQEG